MNEAVSVHVLVSVAHVVVIVLHSSEDAARTIFAIEVVGFAVFTRLIDY
jgi:hypothetical protein